MRFTALYTLELRHKFGQPQGVFNGLSSSLPLGVIPQENSIFGTVVETYDLMRTSQSAFIRGEIILKVDHCLLVKKGVRLHQIQKVLSHEQVSTFPCFEDGQFIIYTS